MKASSEDAAEQAEKKLVAVNKILQKVEDKLEKEAEKATLGDYIKLLQLQKELQDEGEEAKEIKVQWVEPPTAKPEK